MKIPSASSLSCKKPIVINNDVYKNVLKKCIESIVKINKTSEKTYLVYKIPEIIIGSTNYNVSNCIIYIKEKLTSHGYIVEYIGENYIYIDWGGEEASQLTSNNKQVKKEINKILKDNPGIKLEVITE